MSMSTWLYGPPVDMEIIIAVIAALPPTVAAFAAWRHVRPQNGRGNLNCQLGRLESKMDALMAWAEEHQRRGH